VYYYGFSVLNIIYFLEQEEMFIPKLGNQKFSTLAELLQEQDNFNFNVSQTSMFQLNTYTY